MKHSDVNTDQSCNCRHRSRGHSHTCPWSTCRWASRRTGHHKANWGAAVAPALTACDAERLQRSLLRTLCLLLVGKPPVWVLPLDNQQRAMKDLYQLPYAVDKCSYLQPLDARIPAIALAPRATCQTRGPRERISCEIEGRFDATKHSYGDTSICI